MLAYVFWHRPQAGVEVEEYEAALRQFHSALGNPSACFRIGELPFGDREAGYEDWYLVEDWTHLGELNIHAIEGPRRGPHDRTASLVQEGWGAVYALIKGAATIPDGVEWRDKPRGEPSGDFVASLAAPSPLPARERVSEATRRQRRISAPAGERFSCRRGRRGRARPRRPGGASGVRPWRASRRRGRLATREDRGRRTRTARRRRSAAHRARRRHRCAQIRLGSRARARALPARGTRPRHPDLAGQSRLGPKASMRRFWYSLSSSGEMK